MKSMSQRQVESIKSRGMCNLLIQKQIHVKIYEYECLHIKDQVTVCGTKKLTAHCFLFTACSVTVFVQSCQSDKCHVQKKKHA